MTGEALLDRIAAAGAAASLAPDNRVRITGASRLPAELLDLLRQNREGIAGALVRRQADPCDVAERAAMAEHYATPAEDRPWRPGDPDPLGAGLLAAWHASCRIRLAALSARLQTARPRRVHGVRELDQRAWEAAARAAAGLPRAEWEAWRSTVEAVGARQ